MPDDTPNVIYTSTAIRLEDRKTLRLVSANTGLKMWELLSEAIDLLKEKYTPNQGA